jgi:hypothetical protein
MALYPDCWQEKNLGRDALLPPARNRVGHFSPPIFYQPPFAQMAVKDEVVKGRHWPGFAGIAPLKVPAISREEQFAEKLHDAII